MLSFLIWGCRAREGGPGRAEEPRLTPKRFPEKMGSGHTESWGQEWTILGFKGPRGIF